MHIVFNFRIFLFIYLFLYLIFSPRGGVKVKCKARVAARFIEPLKSNENTIDVFRSMIRIRCATWPFNAKLYVIDASWHEEHESVKIVIVPLLNQKLLPKNFLVKTAIFRVFALWRLIRWSLVKSEGTSEKESQKSYRMRFSVAL